MPTMDDIVIGKRICLRPLTTTSSDEEMKEKEEKAPEQPDPPTELFTKQLRSRRIEGNRKRERAQALYYAANNGVAEQNLQPLGERLGGPLRKRRQGINNTFYYQYTNNEFFLKKRFVPPSIQRRLNAVARRLQIRRNGLINIQVRTNMQPNRMPVWLRHSLKSALTPSIQEQLKIFAENVTVPTQIDNEPLPVEAATQITLNARFTAYE